MDQPLKQLQSRTLRAEYDPNTQELIVTFANGVPYSHQPFPQAEWDAFEKATSKGQFYTSRIRGLY